MVMGGLGLLGLWEEWFLHLFDPLLVNHLGPTLSPVFTRCVDSGVPLQATLLSLSGDHTASSSGPCPLTVARLSPWHLVFERPGAWSDDSPLSFM